MRFTLIVASLCAALAGGCATTRTTTVSVERNQHRTREVQTVRVSGRLPAAPAKRAVQSRRPGDDVVWIKGHYVLRDGDYVWVRGAWRKPPFQGAVWVPGYVKETRSGLRWVPTHWR